MTTDAVETDNTVNTLLNAIVSWTKTRNREILGEEERKRLEMPAKGWRLLSFQDVTATHRNEVEPGAVTLLDISNGAKYRVTVERL